MKLCFPTVIILFLYGCKPGTSEDAAATATADSLLRLSPEVKPLCLDTAWLRQHDIGYTHARNATTLQWALILSETDSLSDPLEAVAYHYTVTSDPACSFIHINLVGLEVTIDGKKHMIPIENYVFYSLPDVLHPDVEFGDYNFDNYTDISIYAPARSGVQNVFRHYFLFEPKSRLLVSSKVLNQSMVSPEFDPASKTITTFVSGGHAGKIGVRSTYRYFSPDSLLLLSSTSAVYNDTIDAYIHTRRTRLKNGEFAMLIDTVPMDEAERLH